MCVVLDSNLAPRCPRRNPVSELLRHCEIADLDSGSDPANGQEIGRSGDRTQ